jgi:hypothetical protein
MLIAVVELNSITLSQSGEKIFGILAVLEIILSIVVSLHAGKFLHNDVNFIHTHFNNSKTQIKSL